MELQESIKGLTTEIFGKENTLNSSPTANIHNVRLSINGTGNTIIFGDNVQLRNLFIEIQGNNNKIKIGSFCKVQGHFLMKGNSQSIRIGSKTTFQHNCYLLSSEGKNIVIGRDCMFSNNVDIRTTDAHSIISIEDGKRTNFAQDVTIGHHVWVAAKVLISKGVIIPDNCIVGGNSVVTRKFDEANCTIAGSPASVVKRGVTWSRERLKQ